MVDPTSLLRPDIPLISPPPMVVHHYVPFTSNVGDLFVRDGIHKRLRETFPGVKIEELPANDPHKKSGRPVGLQGENLERTNEEADLVIVGGSNMYQGPDWRFVTSVEAIEKLSVPLAFIGLGVGSIRGKKSRPLSERSRQEIIASHRKAIGVAVRDVDTVEFLAELGLNASLTGCPATFISREPFKQGQPRRVLVSAPPERFLPKWGHKGYFTGKVMQATFERVLGTLKDTHADFDVVAQDAQDMKYLPPMVSRFNKEPLYFGMETNKYLDCFREADLVVCYRLHMAIASLGMGLPFLLVNFDQRTAAFRNTFNAAGATFDAFGLLAQRRLAAAVKHWQEPDAALQNAWKQAIARRDELWEVTRSFYASLAQKLAS